MSARWLSDTFRDHTCRNGGHQDGWARCKVPNPVEKLDPLDEHRRWAPYKNFLVGQVNLGMP